MGVGRTHDDPFYTSSGGAPFGARLADILANETDNREAIGTMVDDMASKLGIQPSQVFAYWQQLSPAQMEQLRYFISETGGGTPPPGVQPDPRGERSTFHSLIDGPGGGDPSKIPSDALEAFARELQSMGLFPPSPIGPPSAPTTLIRG